MTRSRKAQAPTIPKATVNIVAKKGEELPAIEVLANDIAAISRATKQLTASRLRTDALIMLISHSSRVSQKNVKAVIEGLQGLEARYLK